ncbi:MAG: hypothetical protein AAF580_15785 [Pseudomonadota bacterium]
MSAEPAMIARQQALRTLLAQRAGEVTPRLVEGWQGWCARQRAFTHPAGPRLHIIAPLSGPADLALGGAFSQILGLSAINASVTFVVPTAAAANLVRGSLQQDGLDQLCAIVVDEPAEAIAATLPPEVLVCVTPPDALVSAAFVEALTACMDRHASAEGEAGLARDPSGVVLGRAADVAAGETGQACALSDPLASLLDSSSAPGAVAALMDGFEESAARLLPSPTEPAVADPARVTAERDNRILVERGEGAQLSITPRVAGGQIRVALQTEAGPRGFVHALTGPMDQGAAPLRVSPPLEAVGRLARQASIELTAADGTVSVHSATLATAPGDITPSMLTAYLNRGGGGNPVINAFAAGTGCRLAYAEDAVLPQPGVPVVWGVLRGSKDIIDDADQNGQYFYYIDHAYFGRGHMRNYRITRNGFEAGAIRQCPHDRIAALDVHLAPWRRGGREILCCPPTDYFMAAHGCQDWLEETLQTLRTVTDRPVVVRTKPAPGQTAVPLHEALKTAHALVTHSSNVAIEAAVLGTPVFVAPTSAAAPVGRTDLTAIEEPVFAEREPWLAHLAYNQFSLEEIRSGKAWRLLMALEGRPFAL